jgi:uncharacterized protein YegP (UPF0339 family)
MASRPYPSFWIYRDKQNQWRWTYEASNGRTIAVSSEAYVRKADCKRAIEIMKDAGFSPVWTPQKDARGS